MKKGYLATLFLALTVTAVQAQTGLRAAFAKQAGNDTPALAVASTNDVKASGAEVLVLPTGGGPDPDETIQEQASDFTEHNKYLGIIAMYGPDSGEEFHDFMTRVSNKYAEKDVPLKIWTEKTDTPGVVFAYFVDGKQHGPFNFDEFVAMLPEAERDFRDAHPNATASTQTVGSIGTTGSNQVASIDYQ